MESGEKPFVNNGTPEGTTLLLDINTIANETSDPLKFTSVGDVVYFTARDPVNDLALYVSDGTPEGTRLVADIFDTFNVFRGRRNLVDFNGTLFFDEVGGLWKSDGTSEGTEMVVDFNSGLLLNSFTTTDENLYFNDNNRGLWVTDGTTEGTEELLGTSANWLTGIDNILYFTVDSGGSGNELWKSDGTAEGTQLVADITEGEDSSFLSNFIAVDDTLYFFKESNQLWQSDGTAGGTFAIEPEEINLGSSTTPSFQNPSLLTELDGELYFMGQSYDTEAQEYVPALLTVEDVDDSIVYRSFNPTVGVHFYTTDVAERDEFLATGNYVDEGASYRAAEPNSEGAEEVYRFFNETTGVHLYTTDEVERDSIQANLPDFTFEGTVFNAYETQVEGSIPVYRFFEPTIGVHLYTPSEVERDAVQADLPNYNFENIAYYALPLEEV